MLKHLKLFFAGLSGDKEEIKKEVEARTTEAERTTYRIWLVLLNLFVSVVFVILNPLVIFHLSYCAYRTYKWMKKGNAAELKVVAKK